MRRLAKTKRLIWTRLADSRLRHVRLSETRQTRICAEGPRLIWTALPLLALLTLLALLALLPALALLRLHNGNELPFVVPLPRVVNLQRFRVALRNHADNSGTARRRRTLLPLLTW